MLIRNLLGVPASLRAIEPKEIAAERHRREIRKRGRLFDKYDPVKMPLKWQKELKEQGIHAEIRFYRNQPPVVEYNYRH